MKTEYVSSTETKGFRYHFSSVFFDSFSFDIYIDGTNKKIDAKSKITNTSMIYIESSNRLSFALGDIIRQESGDKRLIKGLNKTYNTKSVILGDLLTLLSPSVGYLYANSSSPNARRSPYVVSLVYLGIDGLLFLLGSTTFFTDPFDPTGKGLIPTVALLATHRLVQFMPIHFQLSAHNKIVSMGYKFRF